MRKHTSVVTTNRPKKSKERVYGFTAIDYSLLFGTSPRAIKAWIKSGKLNPIDLQSMFELYLKRAGHRVQSQPSSSADPSGPQPTNP